MTPGIVRIGINPITWTNDDMPELGGDIPLDTCLAETKRAGYAGTEMGGRFPKTAAALRPVLEGHGLALVSGWFDGRILERELPHRTFQAGDRLIATGESSDEMFVLLEGEVEVQLVEDGEYRRLDVLSAGMTAGEMAFLDGSPRSADVVATQKVECLVLTRTWFSSLADALPHLKIKLLQALMKEISARLRQANVEIAALQRN